MSKEFIILLIVIGILVVIYFFMTSKKPSSKFSQTKEDELFDINLLIDRFNNKLSEISCVGNEVNENARHIQFDYSIFEKIDSLQTNLDNNIKNFHKVLDVVTKNMNNLDANKTHEYRIKLQTFFDNIDIICEKLKDLNQEITSTIHIEERLKKEHEKEGNETSVNSPITNSTETQSKFFSDCFDMTTLNKRYKSLIKTFHPDSGCGNETIFREITSEYESYKAKLGGN